MNTAYSVYVGIHIIALSNQLHNYCAWGTATRALTHNTLGTEGSVSWSAGEQLIPANTFQGCLLWMGRFYYYSVVL